LAITPVRFTWPSSDQVGYVGEVKKRINPIAHSVSLAPRGSVPFVPRRIGGHPP
jgi:hypothetical protein